MVPSASSHPPGGMLGADEVSPLFIALAAPSPMVRATAFEALTRLPLTSDCWARLDHYSHDVLDRSPSSEERTSVIRAATFIPLFTLRERVQQLKVQASTPASDTYGFLTEDEDETPDDAEALDGLIEDLRSGHGWALVVRGQAGVGKSALLEYAVAAGADMRVIRAVGVESEMELAFAGLHQLCAPPLDRFERLPTPQRDALGIAFGLRSGGTPDRFLVGLAALTLLSEAAEEGPLLCLVDDTQWLDRASAQALAFMARRLLAERVGLIFAAREPGEQLRGLPELEVQGLQDEDARALLRSVVRVRLDERVRDRVLAESKGNPLALLELPRGLSPTQLAGGFGLVGAQAVPARIEESYRPRLEALPADTRVLLLVAVVEPVGDPVLVWQAADRPCIPASAAAAAEADGLVEIGTQVRFRHPLVRSAVRHCRTRPMTEVCGRDPRLDGAHPRRWMH